MIEDYLEEKSKETRIPNKPLEYERELWPVFSFAGGPTQLPRTIIR